jgi:hypothetical protein
VVSNHGQVVKMVGDEVLFVTDQSADAAAIALRLTSPDRDSKGLPALRVCMATGRVLTRFGDVYGPGGQPGRAADVAGQTGYRAGGCGTRHGAARGRRIPAAAPAARGRARHHHLRARALRPRE